MTDTESNPLGLFGRYLSLWVALCIAAGVGLGALFPSAFEAIAGLEFASVNLVVALFIWVMIFPMMVQVDLGCLRDVGKRPGGLALTLVINWLIKPFSMRCWPGCSSRACSPTSSRPKTPTSTSRA